MFVAASTFDCPPTRFRPVVRSMSRSRRAYCTPPEVVAVKLLPVSVWIRPPCRFRFTLSVLLSSEVPSRPSLGSNCSSGGKNRAFFWLKKSSPEVAVNLSDELWLWSAVQSSVSPDTMRQTFSSIFESAAVWSGLLGWNVFSLNVPSGLRRRSTNEGVNASTT